MIQHITKDPHDSDISYIQSRAEMNYEIIDEYATMMKDGVVFDEVSAFIERGKQIYIYDGAHRLEAARKANKPLLIMLRPGTKANAEWLALSANQKHGLRRNTKDKQRVSRNALKHPNAATLSDRQIAKHCQVDHKTVGRIRKDLVASGEIPQIAERTVTRNGKTFTQAAKAEPKYVSIWQLEQSIRAWLNNEWPDSPADQWAALHNIKKQRTTTNPTLNGPALLEKLLVGNTLPGPRRKGDVRQAANNVLDQMNQATKTPCTCSPNEYCNHCWQAKRIAERDRITKARKEETFTPCLACAPTFDPATWARDRAQDICPDCLRALGQAMIEAANEIKIQN